MAYPSNGIPLSLPLAAAKGQVSEMTTNDEMTEDKAVRYACRALTEERETAVAERTRYEQEIPTLASHDTDYRAYLESEVERECVHIENLDAAMRVLTGMAAHDRGGDRLPPDAP